MAAHGRHHRLLATAGAPRGVGAIAKPQFLGHADSHFAQAVAVAGHRDGVARQFGIGFHESLRDFVRTYRKPTVHFHVGLRNFHDRARLANGIEIGVRRETGTGAVPVPFPEDETGRRHQVEHRGDDRAIETRRRDLTKFRKPSLVFRPEAVHHEAKGPTAALEVLVLPALARTLAERWRPGQGEEIIIEFAGLILPPILGGGSSDRDGDRNERGNGSPTKAL